MTQHWPERGRGSTAEAAPFDGLPASGVWCVAAAGPNSVHESFMPRLDDAQDKLETALTKLEEAVRGRSDSRPGLEAQRDEARARYERLRGETRAVSDQLDAAIARLRELIPSR